MKGKTIRNKNKAQTIVGVLTCAIPNHLKFTSPPPRPVLNSLICAIQIHVKFSPSPPARLE